MFLSVCFGASSMLGLGCVGGQGVLNEAHLYVCVAAVFVRGEYAVVNGCL